MAVFDSVVMAAAAWWVTVAGSVSSQVCAESCQISTAYYISFAMKSQISYCRLNVRLRRSYYPSATLTKRHVCDFVSLCFEIALCDSVCCCKTKSWGKPTWEKQIFSPRVTLYQTNTSSLHIHTYIYSQSKIRHV